MTPIIGNGANNTVPVKYPNQPAPNQTTSIPQQSEEKSLFGPSLSHQKLSNFYKKPLGNSNDSRSYTDPNSDAKLKRLGDFNSFYNFYNIPPVNTAGTAEMDAKRQLAGEAEMPQHLQLVSNEIDQGTQLPRQQQYKI